MSAVVPFTTPEQVLAAASSEELLDKTSSRLSHVIHATPSAARADELRVQRGLIRAELLRRIGGRS